MEKILLMRANKNPGGLQPVFFVPRIIIASIGLLAAVHVLRTLLIPELDQFVVVMFGVMPARYQPGIISAFPGGAWSALVSFFTYAFLHADFTHLAINCAWLLAFGSAVVRLIGNTRFVALYLICDVFAALVHIIVDHASLTPMVGASGAISGMMGAAFRAAMLDMMDGPAATGLAGNAAVRPRLRLLPLYDRRFLTLSGVWLAVNVIFGLTGIQVSETVLMIAWDAHIAGFVAGAILIGFFSGVKNAPDEASD